MCDTELVREDDLARSHRHMGRTYTRVSTFTHGHAFIFWWTCLFTHGLRRGSLANLTIERNAGSGASGKQLRWEIEPWELWCCPVRLKMLTAPGRWKASQRSVSSFHCFELAAGCLRDPKIRKWSLYPFSSAKIYTLFRQLKGINFVENINLYPYADEKGYKPLQTKKGMNF